MWEGGGRCGSGRARAERQMFRIRRRSWYAGQLRPAPGAAVRLRRQGCRRPRTTEVACALATRLRIERGVSRRLQCAAEVCNTWQGAVAMPGVAAGIIIQLFLPANMSQWWICLLFVDMCKYGAAARAAWNRRHHQAVSLRSTAQARSLGAALPPPISRKRSKAEPSQCSHSCSCS